MKIRKILLGGGIVCLALAVVILGTGLWEAFGGVSRSMRILDVPGFHQLDLADAGVYAGVYQHQGAGAMPVESLSHLDVRVMTKSTYEEVPVLMNSSGQTFDRLGMQGMPLFNFVVDRPGAYTLSAFYRDEAGPTVKVLLFSQSARDVRQTLIVGVLFFALFLALGIYLLMKRNKIPAGPVLRR